jgi:Glycosyl hydrolases family 39.
MDKFMCDLKIDFNKKIGVIRALHGVNNGPVCYGSLTDASRYFKEISIPYVRLHDTNWPHPREVDIHTVFPDFSRDPEDPESYDFSRTDAYIKSVLDTGAKIIYRLGESIEHSPIKYYIHPPADFQKWARICIGIIRHYNEGWANGFSYGIKYWEIWNEPEGYPDVDRSMKAMWSGTYEQYLELYKVASTMIKEYNPELMVGGFGYTMVNPGFLEMFLGYCRDNRLTLDFFSWHTYAGYPMQMVANARKMKELLIKYGFDKTESQFNEWNYNAMQPDKDGPAGEGNEYVTERQFERLKNEEGASFDAAVLMLLQDCPVDIANYYDAAPTSIYSMFNVYGVPQKAYYAFKAFNRLYMHPERVSAVVASEIDGLYCCAGYDSKISEGVLLVSNFNAECREYSFKIKNPAGAESCLINTYKLDKRHNLEIVDSRKFSGMEIELFRHIPEQTVLLFEIRH